MDPIVTDLIVGVIAIPVIGLAMVTSVAFGVKIFKIANQVALTGETGANNKAS